MRSSASSGSPRRSRSTSVWRSSSPRRARSGASLPSERLPEVPSPAVMVGGEVPDRGRQEKRRRRPEHPLHTPRFVPHERAVGQERVEQHAMTLQPVHPDHHPEPSAAAALTQQDDPAGLDVIQGLGPSGARPRARRPAARVHLGAQLAVPADPVELAARRRVPLRLRERRLGLGHIALQLADPAQALILAERRLDDAPDGRLVAHGLDQERHRPEPQAKLTRDGLRGPVHYRQRLFQAVAGIQRDHAMALGIDTPPAGPARDLGQLVRRQRPESPIRPLGEPLEDDAPGRHVDAEAHGLGGEHHPDQPALEQYLRQPLQTREDPRVVEANPRPERFEDALVERGRGERRAVLDRIGDRLLHFPATSPVEERSPLLEDLVHRPLAPGTAEDEVDRGQPAPRLQLLEDRGHRGHPARVEASPPFVPPPFDADQLRAPRPHALDRVNLGGQIGDVVPERHRTMWMDHRVDGPVHETDPVGDLAHVRDGGREGHEASRPSAR